MSSLGKQDIIEMLIKRVCENKNVNYYVRKNYFINIYRHIPGYYEKFIQCAENIFAINGHDEADVIPEIEKYFGFKHER